MSGLQRKILIVEDDRFVGSLLSSALTGEGFQTVLADSAIQGKRCLSDFDPDIVLVDVDLGQGPNGVDFIEIVRKSRPTVTAILLSKHADSASAGLSQSIPDGVAYLRKSLIHDTTALVSAIDNAARGHAETLRHDRESLGSLDVLSVSQREILHLMALGYSNKEIARLRGVTVSNIEQRITRIFRAFGIGQDESVLPRVEAIRRYVAVHGVPTR